jgi:hypothetical protein
MNIRERSVDEQVGAVEAETAAVRNRVGEDLQALGEKLTPAHVKEDVKAEAKEAMVYARDTAMEKVSEAKDRVEDVVQEAGRATLDFAERNRVPLALIGAGLGWLVASQGRSEGRLRRRGASVFSGTTRDQAEATAFRWGRRSREVARENSLAMAAISVAAGLGVGLALPRTRREEELLRPARRRLLGQARGAAEEVGQTMKAAAREIHHQLDEPLKH